MNACAGPFTACGACFDRTTSPKHNTLRAQMEPWARRAAIVLSQGPLDHEKEAAAVVAALTAATAAMAAAAAAALAAATVVVAATAVVAAVSVSSFDIGDHAGGHHDSVHRGSRCLRERVA